MKPSEGFTSIHVARFQLDTSGTLAGQRAPLRSYNRKSATSADNRANRKHNFGVLGGNERGQIQSLRRCRLRRINTNVVEIEIWGHRNYSRGDLPNGGLRIS